MENIWMSKILREIAIVFGMYFAERATISYKVQSACLNKAFHQKWECPLFYLRSDKLNFPSKLRILQVYSLWSMYHHSAQTPNNLMVERIFAGCVLCPCLLARIQWKCNAMMLWCYTMRCDSWLFVWPRKPNEPVQWWIRQLIWHCLLLIFSIMVQKTYTKLQTKL